VNFICPSSGIVANITANIHVSTLKLLWNVNKITYAHRWHIGTHDLQLTSGKFQTSVIVAPRLVFWQRRNRP